MPRSAKELSDKALSVEAAKIMAALGHEAEVGARWNPCRYGTDIDRLVVALNVEECGLAIPHLWLMTGDGWHGFIGADDRLELGSSWIRGVSLLRALTVACVEYVWNVLPLVVKAREEEKDRVEQAD